jgi:uncharacterized membrane protein (DUF485 family)
MENQASTPVIPASKTTDPDVLELVAKRRNVNTALKRIYLIIYAVTFLWLVGLAVLGLALDFMDGIAAGILIFSSFIFAYMFTQKWVQKTFDEQNELKSAIDDVERRRRLATLPILDDT